MNGHRGADSTSNIIETPAAEENVWTVKATGTASIAKGVCPITISLMKRMKKEEFLVKPVNVTQ